MACVPQVLQDVVCVVNFGIALLRMRLMMSILAFASKVVITKNYAQHG